jgi:hypothetical protein
MKHVIVALSLAVLSFTNVASAAGWVDIGDQTIGVQAYNGAGKLQLERVTNEADRDDLGLAFFYYPAVQPNECSLTQDVNKSFAVNEIKLNFRKFCMTDGDKVLTAYTPATHSEAGKLVEQLISYPDVTIDSQSFDSEGFAELVDTFLE